MQTIKPVLPSEDAEQAMLVQYLEMRGLKFTAIPNHTYNPHRSQQQHNRKVGLRKGFPDIVVVVPGVALLCIEMKRQKGSATSPEQKAWVAALNSCPGVEATIAKGCLAAIAFVERFAGPSKDERFIF
jgi:hypothetical protein